MNADELMSTAPLEVQQLYRIRELEKRVKELEAVIAGASSDSQAAAVIRAIKRETFLKAAELCARACLGYEKKALYQAALAVKGCQTTVEIEAEKLTP